MLRIATVTAALALAANLPAQTVNTAADVGLTMDGGVLTVLYGQRCGPFRCQPFPAGTVSAQGDVRTVSVFGAPSTFYVLAISTGQPLQPCMRIPGFDNALILGSPADTLQFGITSAVLPSPTLGCRQGVGRFRFNIPNGAPVGVRFMLQALASSARSGRPAFTVALAGATQ